MPIAATPTSPRSIPIPHIDTVEDVSTQQCLRLAWELIGTLQSDLAAAQATITDLITAANVLESEVVALKNAVNAAGIGSGAQPL